MRLSKYLFFIFSLSVSVSCGSKPTPDSDPTPPPTISKVYNNIKGLVPDCADPYVLYHDGLYYLYGTGGSDGIKVYMSKNLAVWTAARGASNGYALHKDDVFGDKWFWAPEVYYIEERNKFYMFYSANERISVAESDSPLGPFVQSAEQQKPFHNTGEIDTHLFVDDDGKMYLYYVRFTNGNEIWVAEFNDDMHSIKEETLTYCFGPSQAWEQVQARVNEGPFVLKHNGIYYLTYSGNHYESPKYAVGYATSNSPIGPWKKYDGNPILIGNDKIQGVGHHSFITKPSGCQYIIYHAHNSMQSIHARKMCIDTYEFVPSTDGSPDVLKVNGPTTISQEVCE